MNQPLHEACAHTLFKLQTKIVMYSHGYTRIFIENQYTVMWQVPWLSPSTERTRPYVETRADQKTGGALSGKTGMHGKSRVSSPIKYDCLKLDDSGNCIIRKTWLH